ncbi:YjjW family glycine radical enzyme activase [Clostridium intestinale]|uniref:YjjW family glycine radical enzyme activase n=1 Tax=Clostridium intestinale TaxID=36845 RepID=UPI002DD67E2C|nr:YjjW family glycine radical enzyme activase [Clostridium intestinale]WRY53978.1 YjjW family glycine radical enzyme activase [Clostridium intestinale]
MMKGIVNKIIPFSSVDGPGNRTSIFLQGCNFNCIYCHNPETINLCSNCGLCLLSCPTKALTKDNGKVLWNKANCCNCDSCIKTCNSCSSAKVQSMSADEVMEEIMNYKPFISGITVSGGECTLQEEFLVDLFKRAKKENLTCFIDSNGSKDFRKMNELTKLCDKVMLDVKVWDKDTHNKYIQFDNTNVLNNLEYLISIDKLYEVRTVVVPDIFNNEETVERVSKIIGESNLNIRYKLIIFRALGVREEIKYVKSPTLDTIEQLKAIAHKNGVKDVVIV